MIDALRAGRSMTEEAAVRLLMRFLFDYEQIRRPVSTLSGGERTRLAFLGADAGRARTASCSTSRPTTSTSTRSRCSRTRSSASTAPSIAVSHDRYFLDRIADRIVLVADGEVRSFEGGWSANAGVLVAG